MTEWTMAHPYLTTFIALWLIPLLGRILRAINIALRGYPTHPLMDADGDIVHPKKEIE